MFKLSKEYQEIKEECKDILKDEAEFSCLVDGIIEYHLKKDDIKYLFFIIADDDYVRNMSVEWLIDLKRVSYFCSEIVLYNKGERVSLGSKTFTALKEVYQS